MEFNIQRERNRINQILAKCHVVPSAVVKRSMSKLRRHKKTYSYDPEPLKESGASLKSLMKSSAAQKKTVLMESESPPPGQLSHMFTFQTLREALAVNPDSKALHRVNLVEQFISKSKVGKQISSNYKQHTKLSKVLQSFKDRSSSSNRSPPTFLKILSKSIIKSSYKTPSCLDYMSEGGKRGIINESSKNNGDVLKKKECERNKNKVLRVILPKSVRGENLHQPCDNEAVLGWIN